MILSDEFMCAGVEHIDVLWPRVVKLVKSATISSMNDYTEEDIYKQLKAGKSLLWVLAPDGRNIVAEMTTELSSIGSDKVLVITSCAGKMPEHWVRLLKQIEKYAEYEKCDLVRLYGRKGWSRFLKNQGYVQPWIVCEKRL